MNDEPAAVDGQPSGALSHVPANGLVLSGDDASLPTARPDYCAYCGAPLDPHFYFCLRCATPYKHFETLLPRPVPLYEGDGTRIARRAPQAMRLFWTYFAVVVSVAVFVHLTMGEEDYALRTALGSAAIFVTTCVFAVRYWRSLVVQLRCLGFLRAEAWLGLLALAPMLGINYAWNFLLAKELLGEHAYHAMRDTDTTSLGPAAAVMLICVLPAVTEELAFRGLLQHWLQVALRPWRAIVIASALFAALHFSVYSAPYIFMLGMVLGWTKWKSNSLYPSMLIHFLHNLIAIEIFTR